MIFVTILNNEELTYIGNKRKKIDREKQKDFRVPFAKLKFETSHLYSLSLRMEGYHPLVTNMAAHKLSFYT